MKMQNENDAIGIHVQPSMLTPSVLRYVYEPRQVKPIAVPPDEMANRIFLPARSTKNVDMYAPTNWIIPTIIADIFGGSVDPDSAKMFAV